MDRSIPIIVVGYNRPKALQRLLNSLLKASYPVKVELIISIDGEEGIRGQGDKGTRGQGDKGIRGQGDKGTRGQGEEVRRIATEFKWPFGEKKLIFHETNMGLRKHVISCGDLSADYEGVIVLEDDLYVAPGFYEYTLQAFDFYKDDPKIAGISLYSHAYNETAQFPFRPLADESDVFFLQYAASLGQFWSREGWEQFRAWYPEDKSSGNSDKSSGNSDKSSGNSDKSSGNSDESPGKSAILPPNINLWPESSWKKYFIRYIVQRDLYFVYPRFSLTTNFSDEGTNMRVKESLFQVPLWLDKQVFSFKPFDKSNAVYDVYCEIIAERLKRMVPSLKDYDFEVDLYGMKSKQDHKAGMFLSSRKCGKPVSTFGREMKPHEMNIVAEIPGDYFSLGKKEGFAEQNYFVRLLKCHEKKELAYWYPIREYHFYKNRLLTTKNSSKFFLNPGFAFRKFMVMANYTYRYFKKK